MAHKVDPNAQPTPPAPAEPDISDLSVIAPDLMLTIAGREVTVREYRFIDGLRARAKAAPLIADLESLVTSSDAADATVEDYLDLLAKHDGLARELMLDSVDGADADWLDGLSANDGEELLMAWWGVCGRFFVRRVLSAMREKLVRKIAQSASAGATSSPASSAPGMDASTISAPGTPSVN